MTFKRFLSIVISTILMFFITGIIIVLSPIISMLFGEFIKEVLCNSILSFWGHCSYVDPIGDIPDLDLLVFVLPSRILIVCFFGYLLNGLYKTIKGGEKPKNDYFIGLIILIILIPLAWIIGILFFFKKLII